jgi:alpha-glucosidase
MQATGGLGEMYVMFGSTPNDVILQYHKAIVGHAPVPPKWALGWHQSRRGYKSAQALTDSVANYDRHGIPLDA